MNKSKQTNPGVGVRFSVEAYNQLAAIAEERRWSIASLVSWCAEQQLDLPSSHKIKRR